MLKGKKFDVEHALSLYALSYFTLPAEGLYEPEQLKEFAHVSKKCHIYIVGFVPRTELVNISLSGRDLCMTFKVLGKEYDIVWIMDDGVTLLEIDGAWFLSKDGNLADPPPLDECAIRLNEKYGVLTFLVKYIGQAYGKEGSRNALDRLMKHEKLQEIAIKGVPEGYRFQVLMLQLAPINQVITMFNPRAEDSSMGNERITQGLDKLFGTTEKERVSLYEAALIRYFLPSFNREFIDSFPSTNLKILQDCYDKDFAAVSAEINFEPSPLTLYSESVAARSSHLAYFDLHDEAARKVFFEKA